jgi:hypothetical protein
VPITVRTAQYGLTRRRGVAPRGIARPDSFRDGGIVVLLYAAWSAKVPRQSIRRGYCDAIASNFTK